MTKGFSSQYWQSNYSDPSSMDGIGNAKEHARYLKSYFALEYVDVSTVIDFGFGHGSLFKEIMKTFVPHTAVGIEPSEFIFKKTITKKLKPVESTHLSLVNTDIKSWLKKSPKTETFDLGICTSVFQYIPTKDLKEILPVIARKVKFLYLTVPTDIELNRQVSELEFKDEYAIHRTRAQYQKLLRPHFTFISSRVLESKYHFNDETTPFTDLVYRY